MLKPNLQNSEPKLMFSLYHMEYRKIEGDIDDLLANVMRENVDM